MKTKIAFLGSKPVGWECLKYLIQQSDELQIEIIAIATQHRKEFSSGKDLTLLAQQNGIPVLENIDALPECDIIYSVQYHEILKEQHIAKARQIAINLHMAPLPEYRGCNQFSFAILDNKTEFGTTIHQIKPGIDNGAILFQKRFTIPQNIWVQELYDKTAEASLRLFKQTLKHIIEGNYQLVTQESLIPKYGTSLHYRREINEIKKIHLDWEAGKIERHLRATYMPGFEKPYTLIDGKKVYFQIKED